MKIKIKSSWPGILWLILSTVAFCLPGSTLPREDWLGKIHADKWVHIGIFSVMIFLWCTPLLYRPVQNQVMRRFVRITIIFFSYGVLIEFIQHFFISGRSFDLGDIVADAIGCIVGFLLSRRQWKATLN